MQNSSNIAVKEQTRPPRTYRWWLAVAIPAWVMAGFLLAQLIVAGIVMALKAIGVPLALLNATLLNTLFAAAVYTLSLGIVVGVPWWIRKRRTGLRDVGVAGLPQWMDILLAPAGFIVYLLLSGILVFAAGKLFPGFDVAQVQDVGFESVSQRYELLLAFVTLVVVAPIAEELLFRGYLYGKLRRAVPIWLAMVVTSVLFGFIHGQWNVGIDVFALSMVACVLREVTGSIWAGILLHMIKNGLAFYILFINTSFLVK